MFGVPGPTGFLARPPVLSSVLEYYRLSSSIYRVLSSFLSIYRVLSSIIESSGHEARRSSEKLESSKARIVPARPEDSSRIIRVDIRHRAQPMSVFGLCASGAEYQARSQRLLEGPPASLPVTPGVSKTCAFFKQNN